MTENDDVNVPLSKPIIAHGEEISSITITEPTGGDIMDSGHPMSIKQDGQDGPLMVVNTKAIGKLISKMGKIPLSSVKLLNAKDFQACTDAVMGFFGGMPETD